MKKLTTEQMKKLGAAIRTLYQLEDELSSDFEGNYQVKMPEMFILFWAQQTNL